MKVVESEDNLWELYEHEDRLFFDGNYTMSFIGYSFPIELNEEEITSYNKNGKTFLDKLAHDLNYSCPIHESSKSAFKNRLVSKEIQERIYACHK